jgi:hypothetical protein
MRVCEQFEPCRSLVETGQPLAVVCQRCRHRALLTVQQLEVYPLDRRLLRHLPLLCRCGSRQIELILIETPDDIPAFLAGDLPAPPHSLPGGSDPWRPTF